MSSTFWIGNSFSLTHDDEEVIQDSETAYESSDPFSKILKLTPWKNRPYPLHPDFRVTPEWQEAYKFWLMIYSELAGDQGVIHDAEDLSVIYKSIDFSDINRRTDIHKYRKEFLRKRRVDSEKKQIATVLAKFKRGVKIDDETFDTSFLNLYEDKIKKRSLESLIKNIRFQLGQKDKIIRGVFYSGLYLDDFEKVFKERGLPLELTRLPFVESSFNPLARSKVGASGLWQIMPFVPNKAERKFQSVDLRNFPPKAVEMAAKLLFQNYRQVGSWPLAVVAYNHGVHGIARLIKICDSNHLHDLTNKQKCRGKRLGFASRNFWPSFLAVLEIEKNAPQYLGPVYRSQPLRGKIQLTTRPTPIKEVLEQFQGNREWMELFNPHFSPRVKKGLMMLEKGVPYLVPLKSGE